MTDNNELNWIRSQGRGKLYGFFSAFFSKEVNLEKLDNFHKECLSRETKEMEEKFGNIITGSDSYSQLMEYKNKAEKDKEDEELKYRVEFAHLFLLPEGVRPYESVYRGKKKLLMDKPWEEVKNFYRKVGVVKDKEEHHPEDHISVELGFMSFISHLTAESLEEERDVSPLVKLQIEFLQEHLLKWLPQLKDNILENKYADIYRPLVKLVEEFLQTDIDNLYNVNTYLENCSSSEAKK